MKRPVIAIVGSLDGTHTYDPPLAGLDGAAQVGEELGRALADAGCEIIAYSSSGKFLEAYVVTG
jgi:hypothetical protein